MYEKEKGKLLFKLLKYNGLVDLMKKYRVIIAGGAINSVFSKRKICDFDLYFKSIEDIIGFEKELVNITYRDYEDCAFKMISATDNALTYKCKYHSKTILQIINASIMIKQTPEEIFNLFDWTICMGAYNCATEEFTFHKNFFEDINSKKLYFNARTLYPICSLYRSIKYQRRGYRLTGLASIKLSLAINALEMNTYADLKTQLMGIDTLILKELTDRWTSESMKDEKYDAFEAMQYIEHYLSSQFENED